MENILYLIIGAIIGFGGSVGIEYIKRYWEENDRKEKNKNILKAIEKEIEEGINRCEGLIGFAKNNRISFSRIYVTLWDSVRFEICQSFDDSELLKYLHQIYYYFDLINFNMEAGRFGRGAAFAIEYTIKIKDNFEKFKIRKEKLSPNYKSFKLYH